uniref:Uncharacterized protein n=1 Tax=Panagrolaimus davidi TaxID=227884 RepID=A0A914PWM7_9BILA
MAFFKFILLSFVFFMALIQLFEAASLSDKNPAVKMPENKIPAIDIPLNNGSLISDDAELAATKSKCGGGCTSSSQCANYDGGNTDCRCSWFSCKLYNKKTGKEIQ